MHVHKSGGGTYHAEALNPKVAQLAASKNNHG